MRILTGALAASLLLTGCLKTRNEVRDNEQRNVMQQQVVSLQRNNADVSTRFSDLEEQMRDLTGRVDVVENRQGQGHSSLENSLRNSQQQNADLTQKVALLQEALGKMERDIQALNAEIQAVRAEKAAAVPERSNKSSKKDSYDSGEEFFDKKDWKQAILNYQKYRDDHPKGNKFPDATYKIGVAFQELGLKDEAKTFYDEVVSKFPKSEEARRAKIRLKGLKK
ncbi:MAG: tetratricopeptide repeat protein [Bdellovibrio sp.]